MSASTSYSKTRSTPAVSSLGDAAVEAGDLGLASVANAHDLLAVGDQKRFSVGGDVVGIVELADDFGVRQHLVGLQSPVEDRNGDRRLATPEHAVEMFRAIPGAETGPARSGTVASAKVRPTR